MSNLQAFETWWNSIPDEHVAALSADGVARMVAEHYEEGMSVVQAIREAEQNTAAARIAELESDKARVMDRCGKALNIATEYRARIAELETDAARVDIDNQIAADKDADRIDALTAKLERAEKLIESWHEWKSPTPAAATKAKESSDESR